MYLAPESLTCEGARLHAPMAINNEAALATARNQNQNDELRLLQAH